IWDALGPTITGIAGWIGDAWDSSWPIIKDFGNDLVATFVGAFEASKSLWLTLPEVLGDVVYSAANAVLDGIGFLINSAIDRFNDLRHLVGLKDGDFSHVELFKLTNPYQGAAGKAAAGMAKAFQGAFANDFLGGVFNDIADHARK